MMAADPNSDKDELTRPAMAIVSSSPVVSDILRAAPSVVGKHSKQTGPHATFGSFKHHHDRFLGWSGVIIRFEIVALFQGYGAIFV